MGLAVKGDVDRGRSVNSNCAICCGFVLQHAYNESTTNRAFDGDWSITDVDTDD